MITASQRVLPLDGRVSYPSELVGGKGASVARMRALGLRVPPAFALPVEEGRRFLTNGERLDDEAWEAVLAGLADLENATGCKFGDGDRPLLVSVRSGAPVSMPGMMDTILNLGMNPVVEEGLARLSGDAKFARAIHVRFVSDFGHTVLGAILDPPEADTTPDDVHAAVRSDTGRRVPYEPREQLRQAIHAVFKSWRSRRAAAYRAQYGISADGGTAVVVQAMVFGNLGELSGTGVLFSRNPLTGEPQPYGEWLAGAQGEDIVSGGHSPSPLGELRETMPELYAELEEAGRRLESENEDAQDIEFTVERGCLYLLQTRRAKRSPVAAVRIAVDLATEGVIDRATALRRISPEQAVTALAPRVCSAIRDIAEVLARGTPACPGVATGEVVLDSETAERARAAVVLARPSTSPEDIGGMIAARAVVTERGGATSHAAVVTRALGRPSVVGIGSGQTAQWTGRTVTVDGSTGTVYAGELAIEKATPEDIPGLCTLVEWARELSPISVVEDAPGAVDLDTTAPELEGAAEVDVDELRRRLRGATAATGAILATAPGARAVLQSGVSAVVRKPDQHQAALLLGLAQAQCEIRTVNEQRREVHD
jgi:pyruvate,orthophosphate dikinase